MTAAVLGAAPPRRRIGAVELVIDDDQPTFWDRVEAGRWEPGTLAALLPLLGPDAIFLDLGAWVGPLSLLAAAHGARVIAVEADPAARDQLRRNLNANPALAERIEVVAAAVAPEPGTVRLGARRKPGDSMSSVLLAEGPLAWSAPAVTPAMLAERLGPTRRLVVKIDVEGAEYRLLPHLGPLIASPDTVVLVSFHPVILRQAGVPDVAPCLRAALEPFAGWHAFAVDDDGPRAAGAAPDALLREADHETWLLRRP